MGRRRAEQETPPTDLREAMRQCRDALVERIRKGYGDDRVRREIEAYREKARAYYAQDPKMWTELAAEIRPK